MKNLIYVYLLSFTVFFQFSCSNSDHRKKSETNNIDFRKYEMDSICHLFGDTLNPAIEIELSMNYPVGYENSPVLQILQKLMLAEVTANTGRDEKNPELEMRKFMEKEIETYLLQEKIPSIQYEKDEIPASFSGQYISNVDTIFNKGGIFCFFNKTYQFKGGAHGFDRAVYTCVDLETGSVITGENLFKAEYYESMLPSIIVEKLAEEHNLNSPKELEDEKNGFFDINDIKPTNNFYLNEEGITFVYNPIEIAAHFIGISEVFIPYGDISFMLADESPVKRIINN